MKIRKTGKSDKVKLTFGERDDARKVGKISSLKASSKAARQISKGLRAGDKRTFDVKNILVTIKGGYSKSYKQKLNRMGAVGDDYYHMSFYADVDTQWTTKEVLNHIEKSMKDFDDLPPAKKAGSGPQTAPPRISEVDIKFVYRK